MKEAAGEANLTVITIILIGVVVAIAIPLVNSLMSNAKEKACCTDAGGYMTGTPKVCGGETFDKTAYDSCMGNKGVK